MTRRLSHWRGLMAVALLLLAAACDPGGTPTPGESTAPLPTPSPAGKVDVVTTTTQIRSMAEAVAGNVASVRSILTPGTDPHTFEPRPSDILAVAKAAVIFKNGIGLDDWMDKIFQNVGGKSPLIAVSSGVPIRKGDQEDLNGDPHIWFNVTNAMTMTRNIRDGLVQVDPAHAAQYKANTDAYLAKLAALDKYIVEQVATIPPDQRKLVTNHDVFGYYAARYGLNIVGSIIPSMSTEAQASTTDIANLTEKIKAQHVKAIFLENSINPKLAQQIAGDAGVKVVDNLYGDALGQPGTPAATYEGMMRYDTDVIVSALK